MVDIGAIFGLDISIPTWILIMVGLFIPWYIKYTWRFDTFDKMGVPCLKPWFPLWGMVLFMTTGMYKSLRALYTVAKPSKCFGVFEPTPILYITDVDMLREILVKQFHCFQNRVKFMNSPPLDRIMTTIDDDHWKHVRQTLSPTFSASKIKNMMRSLNECADELLDKLEEIRQSQSGDFHPKDVMALYTYDAIGRTAFGLNVQAIKEPNSEFVKEAQKFSDAFTFKNPWFILAIFIPGFRTFMDYFGIGIVSRSVGEFFRKVIYGTAHKREETGLVQSDFLQLLLTNQVDSEAEKRAKAGDLQNGDFKMGSAGLWSTKGLMDDDVFASALIFFLAGFDTVATAIGVTLYCLAINPECQDKVVEEIQEVIGDKEDISYDDVVNKMQYLDNCFNESLRMHPIAPRVDRVCSEDCVVEGIHIPKGMNVAVSIVGLHYDEEIWPKPEVFDPERFNPDKKATRSPYTFQPFGHGPRNCIGMRLALVEVKIVLIKIIRKYKLVPSKNTQVPLPMKSFSPKDESGLEIKLEKRA